MTIEEFDKTKFTGGMQVKHKNKVFDIYSVDFEEKTIAINEFNEDEDEIALSWKRCENVELIK